MTEDIFSYPMLYSSKPKEIGSESQYEYSYKQKLKLSPVFIQNLLFSVKNIPQENLEQEYTKYYNTTNECYILS